MEFNFYPAFLNHTYVWSITIPLRLLARHPKIEGRKAQLQIRKMLYQFPLVALALGFTPIAQAGLTFSRQATAGAFDCEQVRVDSPNTAFSGFIAADLDSERRYVVTKTTNQKRLLTRFENNTLFTLVGHSLAWKAGRKKLTTFP